MAASAFASGCAAASALTVSAFCSTCTAAGAEASGLPDGAVARRRRRSPTGASSPRSRLRSNGRGPLAGWPGISIWACAAGFSAGASAAASPVRALLVARRFGLASAVSAAPAAEDAALGALPPACASLMTSISWLLRIRAVPLMPRPDATC